MPSVKALLLENIHADAVKALQAKGYEVDSRPGALAERDLIAALEGVDYLGIRSRTYVTRRVLESAPQLSAIGAFCIGTNQIDLEAATDHGVAVFNAPYSNTRSVVELAIAEIISMARRLTDRNRDMHAGIWDKSAVGSHEVRGRTLGIVGYGNIGSQLSIVAESLGMRVLFYDIADRLALGNARRVDYPRGAARRGGDGVAARRRPAREQGHVRRRAVRPDAPALAVPQPVPRPRRRP